MAKCPECKKDISNLYYNTLIERAGRYTLDNGHGGQGRKEIAESYMCPECEANLYDNQDEADQFLLKGI